MVWSDKLLRGGGFSELQSGINTSTQLLQLHWLLVVHQWGLGGVETVKDHSGYVCVQMKASQSVVRTTRGPEGV